MRVIWLAIMVLCIHVAGSIMLTINPFDMGPGGAAGDSVFAPNKEWYGNVNTSALEEMKYYEDVAEGGTDLYGTVKSINNFKKTLSNVVLAPKIIIDSMAPAGTSMTTVHFVSNTIMTLIIFLYIMAIVQFIRGVDVEQ